MRSSLALLLSLSLALGSCRLIEAAVPCEIDENCRAGERCLAGLCLLPDLPEAPDDDDDAPPACPTDDPDGVVPESYVVDSPAALEGLADVHTVEGDLIFEPTEELLVSLGKIELPDLVRVTGRLSLTFEALPGRARPAAFPCLVEVGGNTELNAAAVSTFSLPSLLHVGGRLLLEGGFADEDLPALATAGVLRVEATNLVDLGAFSSLQELGSLQVVRNSVLESLGGLEGVRELPRDLRLRTNPQLRTLAALDSLETLGELFLVERNDSLPTCEAEALRDRLIAAGFRGAALLAGNDDLAACPWHEELACPPALAPPPVCEAAPALVLATPEDVEAHVATACAGSVSVGPGLGDVCLPALAVVEGPVQMSDGGGVSALRLPALVSAGGLTLEGPNLGVLELPRLRTVGAVQLSRLPALPALLVPGLEDVTGDLRVREGGAALELLYAPQLYRVVGELELAANAALSSAHLPWLEELGGALVLRDDAALGALPHLQSLRDAGGLIVERNAALTGLAGVEDLRSLTGDVVVDSNPALSSVLALDPERADAEAIVRVQNNPCLPQEEALGWAEALVDGVVENVVVQNNGGPCR